MLEDYKQAYKKYADQIPNWQKIGKNELCNLYIQNENDPTLAGAYLAAIVYKYWYLINKFYSLSYNVVTVEDVYEWLLDSILYALEHRMWLKPESNIYGDKNGPDKVINRCMKCRRLTYYQSINRGKRKGGFSNVSLDEMVETYSDSIEEINDPYNNEEELNKSVMIKEFVRSRFVGDSFQAFLVDILAYRNVFKRVTNEDGTSTDKLDMTRLIKQFSSGLETTYPEYFAKKYDLPLDKVKYQWDLCQSKNAKAISEQISQATVQLSYATYFEEELRKGKKYAYNSKLTKRDKENENLVGKEQIDFGAE